MKLRLSKIIFIIILLTTTASCFGYEEITEDLDTSLDMYCKECVEEEVHAEKEIIKFFKEEPIYVSLDECIGVALLNNYNIKVASHEYKSAKWNYRNALAQFLPNLHFEGYTALYTGDFLIGGILPRKVREFAMSGSVEASHDLTNGGEQIFTAKANKLRARSNLNNTDFTKDRTVLETSVGYYELLRAKISIEIELKNLYERTAQLKLTQNLEEAGLGTRFDVIRSKSEQAQAIQNFLNAMKNFRTRQAELANIMGTEVNAHLFPIEYEVKLMTLVDEELTTEDLTEIAVLSRNDIRTRQNEIKAMWQERNAIFTEFIPHPRLVYKGQTQGTARIGLSTNNAVGVYFDIPVGSRLGVGTVTKVKALEERIKAQEDSLTQLMRDVKESIISNYNASKVLKERTEVAKKQVEYASESVKLAELRLDAGEGILLDVIQAQTIKNNARIELLSTIVDYNIAQIRLLFDNGTISYENIVSKYSP